MNTKPQLPPHIANFAFDPSQVAPDQGGAPHPVGQYPAGIVDTEIKPTKDGQFWLLAVTFATPAGTAINNYNLGHADENTVRRAKGQLSALCHATGLFNVRAGDHFAGLRGGQCQIIVTAQTSEEGKAKGYTNVTKVLDRNGNEPGKAGAASTAQSSAFQPAAQTQQPAQQAAQTGNGFDTGVKPQGQPAPAGNDPWASNAGNTTAATAAPAGNTPPWGQR